MALCDLAAERVFLREPGSGTRAVLEQLLYAESLTPEHFAHSAVISSFELIKALVAAGAGISFVYQAVAAGAENLATFSIAGGPVLREFNYVWLKGTGAGRLAEQFAGQ